MRDVWKELQVVLHELRFIKSRYGLQILREMSKYSGRVICSIHGATIPGGSASHEDNAAISNLYTHLRKRAQELRASLCNTADWTNPAIRYRADFERASRTAAREIGGRRNAGDATFARTRDLVRIAKRSGLAVDGKLVVRALRIESPDPRVELFHVHYHTNGRYSMNPIETGYLAMVDTIARITGTQSGAIRSAIRCLRESVLSELI